MTLDVVTIGDSVVDIVVPIPRFLRGNEDSVVGSPMERQLGGSSNFLITASRLGLKAGVLDCLGDDDLGELYREALRREGVDVSRLLVKRGSSTSHCLVLLTRSGRHAYVAFPGASNMTAPEDIDEAYIREYSAFYGSGYSLTAYPMREATLKALKIAHEKGIPTFFDPGPAVSRIPCGAIWEAILLSKYLILNERETRLITGLSGIPESADKLLGSGPSVVVLKRGAEGCAIHTGAGVKAIPGFKVRVVDTTGAGDAFNAAFTYGQLKGWSLEESSILANAVGAVKVTKLGAGTRVPTRDEVSRFLSERGVALELG